MENIFIDHTSLIISSIPKMEELLSEYYGQEIKISKNIQKNVPENPDPKYVTYNIDSVGKIDCGALNKHLFHCSLYFSFRYYIEDNSLRSNLIIYFNYKHGNGGMHEDYEKNIKIDVATGEVTLINSN